MEEEKTLEKIKYEFLQNQYEGLINKVKQLCKSLQISNGKQKLEETVVFSNVTTPSPKVKGGDELMENDMIDMIEKIKNDIDELRSK